jgi:uncharacterized protein
MRNMTRRRALAIIGGGTALAVASMRPARAAIESEVGFDFVGGSRISGTFTLPDGRPPFPVVLIIAGSGPTDRDGNSKVGLKTDAYRLLAAALATRGIASVRYDKRGVGASTSTLQEVDLRFEMFANDAMTLLDEISGDARFDRRFVAGHSEGSLLGMLAVQSVQNRASRASGFVSLCGPGRPAYALIHDQLAAQLPAADLAKIDDIMAKLTKGEMVADVPATTGPLFRASVQPYLVSWFKYDPAVEIKQLKCPIAIVEGTADAQVPVSEAQLLFVAAPAAKLTIVDGMSHTLKHVDPAAGVTQQRTYTDPSIPLDPAVVDAIVSLVQARP